MKINLKNNFIRIFVIPNTFPNNFCFGGGYPVNFQLVDWFEPYPKMDIGNKGLLKPLINCENNEIELTLDLREQLNKKLIAFIQKKQYYKNFSEYDLLAIANYGDSFIIPSWRKSG